MTSNAVSSVILIAYFAQVCFLIRFACKRINFIKEQFSYTYVFISLPYTAIKLAFLAVPITMWNANSRLRDHWKNWMHFQVPRIF